MNIITKFALSTSPLLALTKTLAIEKFSKIVDQQLLANYISANFSNENLIAEINNLSNQWLVVYVNDNPAGYACLTSKGERPRALEGKRAIRIADFGILQAYSEPAVINSLFEKCLNICRSFEGIWINEYRDNPLIEYFENKGFIIQEASSQWDVLPLTAVCLLH